MKMRILAPGPLSTVQDLGRYGFMDTGFSPGGAMDTESLTCANLLVGNLPGEGAIEMTLGGLTAVFESDAVISLTGADMHPCVNGVPIPMYESICLKQGDELKLGMASSGMRTYLAVAGGFDLPLVMGSLSTNLKCGFGGYLGRKLAAGDALPLRKAVSSFEKRKMPRLFFGGNVISVHVMLGPQDDFFTHRGITTFLNTPYTVSSQSDRMGLRLEGEKIENKNGVDIISDGIVTGAIQIPASGTPIIMMSDRQTTGGYAKIATVITSELKKLAQARPGDAVRFFAVTEEMAVLFAKEEKLKRERREYAYPILWRREK